MPITEPATVTTEPTDTPTWTPARALAFAEDPSRWREARRGGATLRPYATRIPVGALEALEAVAPPGHTTSELVREGLRRELLRHARAAARAEAKRAAVQD